MPTYAGKKPIAVLRDIWENSSILIVFAILFVCFGAFVPNFLTWRNWDGLLLSVASVGMVACTMLFCLASGDFDLSVESILMLSGILTAVVISRTNNVPLGIAAGIVAGGMVGLVNGFVIAKLRINALIATLASMQIVRGLGLIVSQGQAVGITQSSFFMLGTSTFRHIPAPVWITLICFAVFGILLHKTQFGRHTLAIGGNREAARLSGIPVTRVKIVIFTLQGLVAGFTGVILAARFASGQPNSSAGFSLDVISACVLGGVSLSGGIGTMIGVVAGVLVMGMVQNAMNLEGVKPFYQYLARGAILMLAVLFDQLKRRKRPA